MTKVASLKIKPEHLQRLREALAPLDTEARRAPYRAGEIPRADAVTDIDKRYRWDLLYASGLKIGDGVGVPGDLELYGYLNDEHIDSALRSFIKPL